MNDGNKFYELNREEFYELIVKNINRRLALKDYRNIVEASGIDVFDERRALKSDLKKLNADYLEFFEERQQILKEIISKEQVLTELENIIVGNEMDSKSDYERIHQNNSNFVFGNPDQVLELLLEVMRIENFEYGIKDVDIRKNAFSNIFESKTIGKLRILTSEKHIEQIFGGDMMSLRKVRKGLNHMIENNHSMAFVFSDSNIINSKNKLSENHIVLSCGPSGLVGMTQNKNNQEPLTKALQKLLKFSKKYGSDFREVDVVEVTKKIRHEKIEKNQKILTKESKLGRLVIGVRHY